MSNNAEQNDLKGKGKGKKAYHRLRAIKEKIEAMNEPLIQASDKLRAIIEETSNAFKCPAEESNNNKSKRDPIKSDKKRSMLKNAPKRIEFEFNCLEFYIDFTLIASEHDHISDVIGVIVYGASRTLCFADCIYWEINNGGCKSCERIIRCDRLEDKPLISFEVSQHGMITSIGKLEGEWWIEDKSDLHELHYRTLDLIWKEALDWTNEIMLP